MESFPTCEYRLKISLFAIYIDLVCRWLTSAIFLALDFNQHSCRTIPWNGEIVCSRKYTAEAFSFIALQVIS